MIIRIIEWSLQNRFLVLLLSVIVTGWGIYAVSTTPVDAIPDLSDVQVIIRTSYPGQAPKVVEDQVTYPLSTAMLSVPRALTVRGYSFFGDSFVYVNSAPSRDRGQIVSSTRIAAPARNGFGKRSTALITGL